MKFMIKHIHFFYLIEPFYWWLIWPYVKEFFSLLIVVVFCGREGQKKKEKDLHF